MVHDGSRWFVIQCATPNDELLMVYHPKMVVHYGVLITLQRSTKRDVANNNEQD